MNTLQIIATIAGILMSFAYYPQAYKIWELQSSREISLLNYSILSVGTAIWFVYGLAINEIAMITSFGVSVIGAWIVLGLSLYFRKQ